LQRFDRKGLPEGTLIRNHQEDFCQALSIAPELKYQQEGGPGLRRCSDLVSRVSSAPAVDVLRLFDAVVFNYLIGNGDAHGKNFSLLRDEAVRGWHRSMIWSAPMHIPTWTSKWL